jgi:NADPH-dependent glutamate synthase beta subunit-like oxidoreductase
MSFAGQAVIFGGGNTAIDVARCLARLGASPLIVYHRRAQDMPAFQPEVEIAATLKGGARFLHVFAPCPTGWRIGSEMSVKIARLAVQTNVFPLYEDRGWG